MVEGKVIVVTGAASGIGRTTAEMLAEAGAKIVVADINPAAAQTVVDGINQAGGSAAATMVDVALPRLICSPW